jgi:hypothetical protein
MQEFDVKAGPWPFGKRGKSGDSNARTANIQVNGIPSPNGLGLHPPGGGYASVCYALGKQAQTFKGAVGFNDVTDPKFAVPAPITFRVFGDGRLLWESPVMKARGTTQDFQINVTGVSVLELRVEAKMTAFNSHAVWIEPHLLR